MNILKGMVAIVGAYLVSTLGGSPVMAATITGTIKVEVYPGSFRAGTYTGDFSYDDTQLTKVGRETMTINGENGKPFGDRAGLLSLNFRFLDFTTGLIPVTYTAKDDASFPDGPVLIFQDGIPTRLSFLVDPDNKGGVFGPNNGIGFLSDKSFRFGVQNGITGGVGSVILETNKPPAEEPTSVPESSSPFVSLLAALGLSAGFFWKKSIKVNN